jgi:hypothetical protein
MDNAKPAGGRAYGISAFDVEYEETGWQLRDSFDGSGWVAQLLDADGRCRNYPLTASSLGELAAKIEAESSGI